MADSTPAPETAIAADLKPSSLPTELDGRPVQPDPSSSANPQLSNPNPSAPQAQSVLAPPPPPIQPSFRPAVPFAPVPSAAAPPQFSPVAFQNPGVPPPGVVVSSAPAVGSGPPPQVPAATVHPMMGPPYAVAGQPMRYAHPMPNGFTAIPQVVPQGAMPPPVYS